MIAEVFLIFLFLLVLNFVLDGKREGFEGTGLPVQSVKGRETQFLPVGFNAPHEKLTDKAIDPFVALDNKVRKMVSQLPTISESDIPDKGQFQLNQSQVQEVPRSIIKEIEQTISERMTNIWNLFSKEAQGKWESVNVLEVRSQRTASGVELITVKINMIERNRIYSKDFVVEMVKLPGIRIHQIHKVTIDDGKNTEVENILRGPDPLASKFYNVMNASLNGEITNEERVQALVEKQKLLSDPGFICFGSKNPGAKSREECEASGGYWDRPVQASEECPFYKANENYPNNRGGARGTGFCELPLGLQPLGFRAIRSSEDAKPLCYNCIKGIDGDPKTLGPCCEEQKNARLYPTLRTPDYAFPGDQLDRQQQQNTLKFRDLSWHRKGPSFEDKGPIQLDKRFLPEVSTRALLEQQCKDMGIPVDGCSEEKIKEIAEQRRLEKEAAQKLLVEAKFRKELS